MMTTPIDETNELWKEKRTYTYTFDYSKYGKEDVKTFLNYIKRNKIPYRRYKYRLKGKRGCVFVVFVSAIESCSLNFMKNTYGIKRLGESFVNFNAAIDEYKDKESLS